MSVSLNSELNLNPLLNLMLQNSYGLVILGIGAVLILAVTLIFFLIKSGIFSVVIEYQDYKVKRIQEEIKDKEGLISDESLKNYKEKILYHLNVAKLNRLLNYSNPDRDLLEYILSCRDTRLAIFYYESAKQYLEKDINTKQYILKKGWRTKHATKLSTLGTCMYFIITLGSLFPMCWLLLLCLVNGESINKIPSSFLISQGILFVECTVLALMTLSPLLKPFKAKKFLALEKVDES